MLSFHLCFRVIHDNACDTIKELVEDGWASTGLLGGALNFFSGRGVRPGFPKYGACELAFASEKGGL